MRPTIDGVARRRPARESRALRETTNLTVLLVAAGAAAVGIALLYVAGRADWWQGRLAAQTLVSQVGSLLVAAVALALLWEFVGKRKFAEEILEKVGIASDVDRAGIVRFTDQYLKDVEWDAYFAGVQKLDIVVAYGRTWRQAQWDQLMSVAARPEARIRIILPDPADTQSLAVLADRFSRTPAKLRDDINEAAQDFMTLRRAGGADVRLYWRRGDQVFSCYRLDSTAVITLYSHSRERRPVPTIVCRSGGTLYDFVRQEVEVMLMSAREAGAKDFATAGQDEEETN